jgi:tRNA(fMet)-specific endonuclease VapC
VLRYMLDTNLCIRVLRDRPQGLRERFNAEAAALCISTVTLAELLYGAEKSSRPIEARQRVEGFAARLDVLSFDSEAAAHYANVRADLERRGQVIGPYDMMTVITGNLDEFTRVAALRAEDWLPPPETR